MDKRKKIKRAIAALSIRDWMVVASTSVVLFSAITGVVIFLMAQISRLDRLEVAVDLLTTSVEKLVHNAEDVNSRLKRIEHSLDEMKSELQKTNDLVQTDMSWRYIYIKDPARKNFEPFYDPVKGTLEFAEVKKDTSKAVRQP
jgi:chromosome segregation ATPase